MNNVTKGRVIAYSTLIFVAGAITGAAVGRALLQPEPSRPRRSGDKSKPPMAAVADHMKKRLQTELSLSADQLRLIEPSVEKSAQEMDAVHRQSMEQVDQIIRRCNRDITPHLSANQQRQLEKMEQDRQRHFRKGPKPPSPPPE
jgi:gas vesicle protein